MVIDQIRAAHRERCFAMEQRKRVDLALGTFLRMVLGWRRELPEAEHKRIAAEVERLMGGAACEWSDVVAASRAARLPFERVERDCLKRMSALAVTLPVWETFGKPIRGFGAACLAIIVAEAGDLDNYSTEAKLWKRMGVAVLDGIRQGGLTKSASAEAWIEHGYNRQRRSRLWNVGDTLIKGNRDGKYRTVYLTRKAHELERESDMPKIKAHRRAQRYMEKRLLRDLWRAWRAPAGGRVARTP